AFVKAAVSSRRQPLDGCAGGEAARLEESVPRPRDTDVDVVEAIEFRRLQERFVLLVPSWPDLGAGRRRGQRRTQGDQRGPDRDRRSPPGHPDHACRSDSRFQSANWHRELARHVPSDSGRRQSYATLTWPQTPESNGTADSRYCSVMLAVRCCPSSMTTSAC